MSIDFTFAGYTFSYPDGSELFAQVFGTWLEKAEKAYKMYEQNYRNFDGSLVELVIKMTEMADQVILAEIDEYIGILFNMDIQSSKEEFTKKYISKYNFNYRDHISNTIEQITKIEEYAESLAENLEFDKASRGEWTGGGFGLGGAIKGAINASILNAGSKILHAPGDALKKSSNNRKVQVEYDKLYNSKTTKQELCMAIYNCYRNLYYAILEDMISYDAFESIPQLNDTEAEQLFENTQKYSKSAEVTLKNLWQCIELYPDKKYLEAILPAVQEDEQDDFDAFIDFWNFKFYGIDFETRARLAQEEAERKERERLEKEQIEKEKKLEEERIAREKQIEENRWRTEYEHYKNYYDYVKAVRDDAVAKSSLETFAETVLIPENHKNEYDLAKKYFAQVINDEPILMFYSTSTVYDGTDFGSGFVLSNKKIYFSTYEGAKPSASVELSNIKKIKAKKGITSTCLMINDFEVGTNILERKDVDLFADMMNKIVSYCIEESKNSNEVQMDSSHTNKEKNHTVVEEKLDDEHVQVRTEIHDELSTYVKNLYNEASKQNSNGTFVEHILLSENHEEEINLAIKSYAPDMKNERILLIFTPELDSIGGTPDFKNGIILSDKKICFRDPSKTTPATTIEFADVKEITLQKKLLFSSILINGNKIDSTILSAKHATAFVDMLNQIIKYCLENSKK